MFSIERVHDSEMYSALSINSYAESLHELNREKFTPVSVETLAATRVGLGVYHAVSWTGSRTTDFFVYKNDKYYLAHADLGSAQKRAYFDSLQSFNEQQSEIPYVKGIVGKAIEVSPEDLAIPVDDLLDSPIAKFLFRDQLQAYQQWLWSAKIPFFPVMLPPYSLARKQDDFMRPLIMRCTDNWSGIITANADLHHHYGFRGVANNWEGEVSPPEIFKREHLTALHKLVPLEDKDYLLSELELIVPAAGYGGLLNGLLRLARNAGHHSLPANYNTFSEAN